MRSSAALSVVIVVFGAITTSPQQITEPVLGIVVPGETITPLMTWDERGQGIPMIYVAVLLIFYRLMSGSLERALERYGRPHLIAFAHGVGMLTGVLAGASYGDSTISYFHSLSYLEGTAESTAPDPLLVVRDAVALGSAVFLMATVVVLAVATVVVAVAGPRWPRRPRTRPRLWRGIGLVELAGCGAVGVTQSLGAPASDPLLPIGIATVGAGLAVIINLARDTPETAGVPPDGGRAQRDAPTDQHGAPTDQRGGRAKQRGHQPISTAHEPSRMTIRPTRTRSQ